MASPSTSLLFVILLFSLITLHQQSTSPAAAAAAQPLSPAAQEYLGAHNEARAAVGVGPLRWSEGLANLSSRLVRYQRNKMSCNFANLTNSKYGGNQLWAGGAAKTPRMAVEKWVEEKQFYNHADNTCAPNHQCGVYTQVVWRNSSELGCAQATCVKENTSLTICLYNPPGNYIGESPY
ncbi:hypothetical protein TIFTF001_002557 [Ficus carica]|uniref:SCP domain-containing protein n=1 Tax=Ficus carica TaxID=3494 RepID=A0AA88CTY2_FICCA|nr:hypothetical protein TIFTF001_002557 [Ficus carica]